MRRLTITPTAYASGTVNFSLQAADASNHPSDPELFAITIRGVATTPVIAGFSPTPGTSGQAGGIALNLNVTFPDNDGSEVQQVTIAGVPAGVTLSAGTWDGAASLWRLTPAQVTGLKLNAPVGWSQNLALTVVANATENGVTASATSSATVIINAPPTGATLANPVAENAPNGTVVGNIVGVDPDGDALTYTLQDNAGGRFSLTAAGVLSVANTSLLNYEAATSHSITVRITDTFSQYKDQVLSVAVTNVNEENALAALGTRTINENVAVGTAVGAAVQATDPDSSGHAFGQQRYYFWDGTTATATSADGRYAINATTGLITTAAALNFEVANPSASYTIAARDNAGAAGYNQATSAITIGITDLNEQNALGAIAAMAVNENVAVGTVVGTVTAATDSDGGVFGQQRYYFWDGTTRPRPRPTGATRSTPRPVRSPPRRRSTTRRARRA